MANFNGEIGACEINFKGSAIAETEEGVTWRYTEEDVDVHVDQAGTNPVDSINTGSRVEVECNLARLTIAKLDSVLGHASGDYISGGSTGPSLTLRTRTGKARYAQAGALILKPYINGIVSTDTSTWVTFPKAFPIPNFEVVYDKESQRTYQVMFKVFPVQEAGATFGTLVKLGK